MRKRIYGIAVALNYGLKDIGLRTGRCIVSVFPKSIKTALWILKITLPISLVVSLLSYIGFMALLSDLLTPIFSLVGLSGSAVLAFITGVFLNIYSVIAVISQLSLSLREITIIAVMSLIAHNLFVETAVQSRTGSRAWHMVALRLGMALLSAFMLNALLPDLPTIMGHSIQHVEDNTLSAHLLGWVASALRMVVKIIVLVFLLMVLQEVLREFNLITVLTIPLSPFIKILGLPESTTFLWIVANTLGLAYGGAVMLEEVNRGRISKPEADLLNYHVAISHSNLEDLLLFAAIGASIPWMLGVRLVIALGAVWLRRWYLIHQGEVLN